MNEEITLTLLHELAAFYREEIADIDRRLTQGTAYLEAKKAELVRGLSRIEDDINQVRGEMHP